MFLFNFIRMALHLHKKECSVFTPAYELSYTFEQKFLCAFWLTSLHSCSTVRQSQQGASCAAKLEWQRCSAERASFMHRNPTPTTHPQTHDDPLFLTDRHSPNKLTAETMHHMPQLSGVNLCTVCFPRQLMQR